MEGVCRALGATSMTSSTLGNGTVCDHVSGPTWHVLDCMFTLKSEHRAGATTGLWLWDLALDSVKTHRLWNYKTWIGKIYKWWLI